jgi:hypothetical protein
LKIPFFKDKWNEEVLTGSRILGVQGPALRVTTVITEKTIRMQSYVSEGDVPPPYQISGRESLKMEAR